MKSLILSALVAVSGMVLISGCGKSEQPVPGTPPPMAMSASEFRPAFASASPEIKALADQVMMDLQASTYTEALSCLAKLAANPALNETQKQAVTALTETVKNKMAAIAGSAK